MKPVSQHLIEALTRLSSRRPIFHSEADFAMALGSELQKIESVEIRMEKPVNVKYIWKENLEVVSTAYLDMFVITPHEKVAIV